MPERATGTIFSGLCAVKVKLTIGFAGASALVKVLLL
jgi:hypothetical protein